MKKLISFIVLALVLMLTPSFAQNKKNVKRSKQKTTMRSTTKTSSKTQSKSNSSATKPKTDASKKKSEFPFCPDNNHPHAIDLDLPSGTLWSCCNVGAETPIQYGGLFSWGEMKEKKKYSLQNYKYSDGSSSSGGYIKIGFSIKGTKYDVAHMLWGETWEMPSVAQLEELVNYCIFEPATINGVNGSKFIGPNGNEIFLPNAGFGTDTIRGRNVEGNYWAGTCYHWVNVYIAGYYNALRIYSNSSGLRIHDNCYRYFGFSVRPVKE